jgi:hypothetical protein
LVAGATIPVGLVIVLAHAVHMNPAKPIPNMARFNLVNTAFLLLSDRNFIY